MGERLRHDDRANEGVGGRGGLGWSASIIITNFNYAQFLAQCIDSALAQTVPAEVIVVDDASTDESREVISSYGTAVRSICFSENRGQAAALNAAIEVGTGDVVMFLDSDDWIENNRVERVLHAFSTIDNVQAVRHDASVVNAGGREIAEKQYSFRIGADPTTDVLRFGRTIGCGGVLALRRNFLVELGSIPEGCYRRGPDGYLLLAAALSGRMATIDEPLYVRRHHAEQLTQQFSTDRSLAALALKRRICEAESAAELAARFDGPKEIVSLAAWWQHKAIYEHAKATKGGEPWVSAWLKHLASTSTSELPLGRKAGELARSVLLGVLPRRLFTEMYWRTHSGRPRLRLVDAHGSSHILTQGSRHRSRRMEP